MHSKSHGSWGNSVGISKIPTEFPQDPWGFIKIPITVPYPYPRESPWESPIGISIPTAALQFGIVYITASDTEFLWCDCETEGGGGFWDFLTDPLILSLAILGLLLLLGLIGLLAFGIKKGKPFLSVMHVCTCSFWTFLSFEIRVRENVCNNSKNVKSPVF